MPCPTSQVCLNIDSSQPHTRHCLYAQGHDRVDNIVVVLLQGLDGLLAGDGRLLHDELDVLGLETRVVDLLAIILVLLGLLLDSLLGVAVVMVVVVVVVVAGVVVTLLLGLSQLLGGGRLGLRVQVLDLGLTEDAVRGQRRCLPLSTGRDSHVGVAGGGLVDVGLVDDEEDLRVVLAKIPAAPHSTAVSCIAPAAASPRAVHSRSSVGGE